MKTKRFHLPSTNGVPTAYRKDRWRAGFFTGILIGFFWGGICGFLGGHFNGLANHESQFQQKTGFTTEQIEKGKQETDQIMERLKKKHGM